MVLRPLSNCKDIIIVAGDISHKLDVILDTLRLFKARYARVFFCPGNHELWLWGKGSEDSLARLHHLLQLCRELGVETLPGEVQANQRRLLIVPLLSWHHPQWDSEPDMEGWVGARPVDKLLSDYYLTRWPTGIAIADGSAARAVDEVNDQLTSWSELLKRRQGFSEVISFSHFLPRLEVNPEKRYLTHPNLAKGVGSTYLRARVELLCPDVHVFGHTHFGYDLAVDGVRYIQAPLAMSAERGYRGSTVALGSFPVASAQPFLVWHSEQLCRAGHPEAKVHGQSAYASRYGRRAEVADAGLQPAPGSKVRVGWLPGRMPVWLFGPHQHRVLEADILKKESAGTGAAGRGRSGQQHQGGSPEPIGSAEVLELLRTGCCAVIDVREQTSSDPSRPAESLRLPHPSMTASFPGLPDDELLLLAEELMANDGPRILVGHGDQPEHCHHAALLLAALLRLHPRDVRPFRGGFEAWIEQGLPVQGLGET
ncbi:unnamed protein product [Polarella glacialis]|uniref:Rhodanese domain-containing protein n=1 Tax=Polarella glacialis TaxID=89957 RepID=A0A813F1W1_POLGL|nr:unnamed protein product [Polarella glacialis]